MTLWRKKLNKNALEIKKKNLKLQNIAAKFKDFLPCMYFFHFFFWLNVLGSFHQYGLKKREEAEAEAAAAAEEPAAGSLTRPKKAVPTGCGDEEEEESIMDTVMKYLPGPLQDMLKK